jgi:hypothetical protein
MAASGPLEIAKPRSNRIAAGTIGRRQPGHEANLAFEVFHDACGFYQAEGRASGEQDGVDLLHSAWGAAGPSRASLALRWSTPTAPRSHRTTVHPSGPAGRHVADLMLASVMAFVGFMTGA